MRNRIALGGSLVLVVLVVLALVTALWLATRPTPNPYDLPPQHVDSLRMKFYNEGDVTLEDLRVRTTRQEYRLGDLSPDHSIAFLADRAPEGRLAILGPGIANATNSHEFGMVGIRDYDDDERYYAFAIYVTPNDVSTATVNIFRSDYED